MRQAVALWENLKDKNKGALRGKIKWEVDKKTGKTQVNFVDPEQDGKWSCIGSERIHPELYKGLTFGDVFKPALDHLQNLTNEIFDKHMSVRAMQTISEDGQSPIHSGTYGQPRNLLGAIWLQFWEAVHGRKDFRPCQNCGGLIEISRALTGKQPTIKFCGDPCRNQFQRIKKNEARALYEQGVPDKQIIEKVGCSLPTLRKWIKEKGWKRMRKE